MINHEGCEVLIGACDWFRSGYQADRIYRPPGVVKENPGRLLGSVPTPPHKEYAAPAFGPGYLLTIRRDSLDLDHVDVWRFVTGAN